MRRMGSVGTVGIAAGIVAAALAVGCGWPRTNEERAAWFFEHGEEWVLDALDDAGADDAQRDAARSVFASHQVEVTAGLEGFFAQHQELLRTLAGGAGTQALLEQQAAVSEANREALSRIGALHEELGIAVGPDTWAEARARMRERVEERMDDD